MCTCHIHSTYSSTPLMGTARHFTIQQSRKVMQQSADMQLCMSQTRTVQSLWCHYERLARLSDVCIDTKCTTRYLWQPSLVTNSSDIQKKQGRHADWQIQNAMSPVCCFFTFEVQLVLKGKLMCLGHNELARHQGTTHSSLTIFLSAIRKSISVALVATSLWTVVC